MRHRLVHNVEDAEKYQEREKHSAAAAHGVVALLLELCHLLLLLLLVVFVFLLNLAHLGRKYCRLRGVLLLLYRKRQHGELYNKGKQKYRNADVAAYELVDKVQDIAQRLTYKAVKEIYSVHVLSKRKGQAGARPARRNFIKAAKAPHYLRKSAEPSAFRDGSPAPYFSGRSENRSGTGSYPPALNGLQRIILRNAK